MRLNTSPINDVALDDISPRETFEGIFGRVYQSVVEIREEAAFTEFKQTIGISKDADIFVIFDQEVRMRSVTPSGPFVDFYQDVQDTEESKNIIILNQKVIP